MRIAIPTESVFAPLWENYDALQQQQETPFEIHRGKQEECERLLANNRVDVALISPLAYGNSSVIRDYRIVPSTVCVAHGWTNIISIIFSENADIITTAASTAPRSFMTEAARIVLDEQYEIELQMHEVPSFTQQVLQRYVCMIGRSEELEGFRGLDLGEEWELAFSIPLPLGIWVCRNDYVLDAGSGVIERMEQIVRTTIGIARPGIHAREQCYEQQSIGDADLREGEMQWLWSEDLDEVLQQTMQLMYYRQILSDMPEIKILGRDEEELSEESPSEPNPDQQ